MCLGRNFVTLFKSTERTENYSSNFPINFEEIKIVTVFLYNISSCNYIAMPETAVTRLQTFTLVNEFTMKKIYISA